MTRNILLDKISGENMFRFLSSSMSRKIIFFYFRDVDESLVMVSAGGGGGRVIVPGNIMRDPRVFRFKLSPDQKYVMLAFRPQRLFRHSFLAQYDLYNIATGRRTKLQPDLDELIKALGGGGPGAPPPLPPGQVRRKYFEIFLMKYFCHRPRPSCRWSSRCGARWGPAWPTSSGPTSTTGRLAWATLIGPAPTVLCSHWSRA